MSKSHRSILDCGNPSWAHPSEVRTYLLDLSRPQTLDGLNGRVTSASIIYAANAAVAVAEAEAEAEAVTKSKGKKKSGKPRSKHEGDWDPQVACVRRVFLGSVKEAGGLIDLLYA